MEINEILNNRIEAYEEGSTPEAEARVAELREEIIPILDNHGLKDDAGQPDVVEGEGQKVEAEYEERVTKMRQEIHKIASERTGKLSQRGEDVVPVLKQLREFAATEEGKQDGAIDSEINRIIEENKKEIERIETLKRDHGRLDDLRKEIDELNQKIAEINEKVKEDPNFDAESIERTRLQVTLYHRQNELRGILVRNPEANNDMPDMSRAMDKANNIISELGEVQKQRGVKTQEGQKDGSSNEQPASEGKDEGKGTPVGGEGEEVVRKEEIKSRIDKYEEVLHNQGEQQNPEPGAESGQPGQSEADKNEEKDGSEQETAEEEVGDTTGDEETSGENNEDKDTEKGKGDEQPNPEEVTVSIGGFKKFLLNVVRWFKKVFHAKDDGFLGKIEAGILAGAAPASLPEGKGIDKEEPQSQVNEEEQELNNEDSLWVKKQFEAAAQKGQKDENDLMQEISEEAYTNTLEERKREGLEKGPALVKYVKDIKLPDVADKTDSEETRAFKNLLYYNMTDIILKRAEEQGIALEDKNGDRPIADVFEDLQKKHFRKNELKASREFSQNRGENGDREQPESSKGGEGR